MVADLPTHQTAEQTVELGYAIEPANDVPVKEAMAAEPLASVSMCRDRLSPRLEAFLAQQDFDKPHLVVDLERVEENYLGLENALPEADIYYAVKANPDPAIVKRLAALGSNFDTASIAEIDLCLDLGIAPSRLSFGNTIKKVSHIVQAYEKGIRLFAFDSDEELAKLAEHAPGAQVYCRVLVDCGGAEWPLSRKFGCSPEMAHRLTLKAHALGLKPVGMSFHVGSQQTCLAQWDKALDRVEKLYADLARAGIKLPIVNMGGGFPTHYTTDIPNIQAYGEALRAAMAKHFGEDAPRMFLEPGRYVVGDAGVIEAEVMLVSRKDDGEQKRWVFLDIGIFSGLAECMGEAIKYPISVKDKEHHWNTGPVVLAGPSCDSVDILYEKTAYDLPLDLKAGDKIRIHSTGAYTTTYSSVGFNGFPPLECLCI